MPKRHQPIDLTNVQIESSIPPPSGENSLSNQLGTLFKRMKPGDSVLLPLDRNAISWALEVMRKKGFKFVTEKEPTGTRVWRTK